MECVTRSTLRHIGHSALVTTLRYAVYMNGFHSFLIVYLQPGAFFSIAEVFPFVVFDVNLLFPAQTQWKLASTCWKPAGIGKRRATFLVLIT